MPGKLTIAAIVVIALGAGYWLWADSQATGEAAAPQTVAVTRTNLQKTVLASGAVEAASLVSVGARVSGQIETLAVAIGDTVEAGDLIAEIENSDQRNAVLQADANLKQNAAQIAAQEANITMARLAVERARTLNTRNLTATQDLEAAEAGLAVAEADLEALRAQTLQAGIVMADAEAALARTRITAPAAGTIVAVLVEQGQSVNANQSAPTLVKIARLDRMLIKAEISEADVIAVRPGMPVSFTLLGAPERRFEAVLRDVEPAPEAIQEDGSSGVTTDGAVYYNARLDVENPEGVLRIGMTAQVTIILESAENALTIPTAALQRRHEDGSRSISVYDPASGGTVTRQVRLGINTNVMAEVVSGLAEGEQVVVGAGFAPAAARVPGGPGGPGGMRPPMLGL